MDIEQLYKRLNDGERFCLKKDLELETRLYCSGEHRYFAPSVALSADSQYIYWHHFGSSAETNTLKDLKFLLDKIFECDAGAFVAYPLN